VNTDSCYQILSKRTAEARRQGAFPPLADTTPGVNRPFAFDDMDKAKNWLAQVYRRTRTQGQTAQI
jgi:hypothetical protein